MSCCALVLKHFRLLDAVDLVAVRREEGIDLLRGTLRRQGAREWPLNQLVAGGSRGRTCSLMSRWLWSHQYVCPNGTAKPHGLP